MKGIKVKVEYLCTVTASNGVDIRLTALFYDGIVNSFRADLFDEDMSASVWMGDEGNETFSELDLFPEYRDTPIFDAWQEIVDGRSDAAMKFEDAIWEVTRRK